MSKRKRVNEKISVMNVETNIDYAYKVLAGIQDGAPRAILNALNRSIYEGRTAGIQAVRETYAIKAGDVREYISMHRASRNDLNAELWSRGKKMPISLFRYRPQSNTTGNRRKRIRVSVMKAGGLKPLGQAFVWKAGVWQRVGDTSRPIRPVKALAVAELLNNPYVVEVTQETMVAAFEKRFHHEVYRLLNGFEGDATWKEWTADELANLKEWVKLQRAKGI
jgi:hypothetical protein